MTLPLPWTLSKDDPAGSDLEDRVQEMFDKLAQQFPIGIQYVSQVPQARVYHNAAVVCTTATDTVIPLNSERYDTASLHDVAVNNSRLTAPTAGLYDIAWSLRFVANAAGFRQAKVKLNNTTFIAIQAIPPVNGDLTGLVASTQYRLAAADYVELVAYQTSGGNLNVEAAGNYSPEFSMHWVSP
jgi:hypothetical protein